MDEPDPAVKETLKNFSARDGYELSLRIFTSANSPRGGPLIVLYHGGGWCMGSTTMVADIARNLVKKLKAVVIAPKYRLAPEYPWPKSLEDGWDAFQFVRENHAEFMGGAGKPFLIGGISAGASMSLVYAHLARDQGLEPKITGIWSACGSVRAKDLGDLEDRYRERLLSRSQEDCVKNPVLSPEMQKLLRECVKADENSQWYNCLVWRDGSDGRSGYGHHGLPRMYQQLCGRDVSRDEGLILDDMLKKEGTETRLDLYKGLPHCFWIALPHVPEFKKWEKNTIDGFGWLLEAS
ncbi:uncharacterized protein MYCFIDRAFT_135233 [Pseudocercospora fijiensis CIRAD86]|uniref:Alpha/beta hydrolase fold-3 domain-containing protein n=1 Tax=Pseudocercospora fijiensis (strain CIRAD86) TaxID=383855 RepID=M2Z4E8_PSEFD|nr:uncharacterized protein MYCFIDRAFT_135233 [Pseudocercospora fijiensis CIRAD86]EME84685.1 hypothetical protein MYCFIDRAFT_135233 [Pseudocercospora fijiensis CIRAD86]